MILYHASDLIWATRIKRTADAMGIHTRPARDPQTLRQRLAEGPVAALIVDLADETDTPFALIDALTDHLGPDAEPQSQPRPRIVAFGPHVDHERLQRARDLGADDVMPRGAFDRNLQDILLTLASRSSPPHGNRP